MHSKRENVMHVGASNCKRDDDDADVVNVSECNQGDVHNSSKRKLVMSL